MEENFYFSLAIPRNDTFLNLQTKRIQILLIGPPFNSLILRVIQSKCDIFRKILQTLLNNSLPKINFFQIRH